MKRGNLFKILDFAKIPVILAGVFLVLKWGSKHGKETIKQWFPSMFTNPSEFDADSIAEKQYYAMWRIGTNEVDLFNDLKTLTKKQLIQVFEAFEHHYYGLGGGLIPGIPLNLFGWYAKELTKPEKVRMREIWGKTGLEITF